MTDMDNPPLGVQQRQDAALSFRDLADQMRAILDIFGTGMSEGLSTAVMTIGSAASSAAAHWEDVSQEISSESMTADQTVVALFAAEHELVRSLGTDLIEELTEDGRND
jgi:hypothetical protein